MKFTFLYICS